MMKVFRLFSYLVLAAMVVSTAFLSSCSKDEPSPVPTVTLSLGSQSAYTLTDGKVEGDIGVDVTFNIEIDAPGGFQSMTITELQGTTEVGSEEFETEQATYSHTITDLDYATPFVVKIQVTDAEGQTGSTSAVISVTQTNLNKLLAFSWQFTSQIWSSDEEVGGDDSENIKDCEEDNVYTFFADGSVQYNFGASTGTNECEGSPNGCEGSCAGDGNTEYLTWTYTEAETEGENDVLTVTRKDTNTEQTTDLVYEILEFGDTQFVGRIDYDLSALFGFEFILTLDETWIAVSKEEKVTAE